MVCFYKKTTIILLFIAVSRSVTKRSEYMDLLALLYTEVIPLNVEQEFLWSSNVKRKKIREKKKLKKKKDRTNN